MAALALGAAVVGAGVGAGAAAGAFDAGEDAALRAEARRLQDVDDLRASARQAIVALAGDDEAFSDEPTALGLVSAARKAIEAIADDPTIAPVGERVAEAGYLLADAAGELAGYLAGRVPQGTRLELIPVDGVAGPWDLGDQAVNPTVVRGTAADLVAWLAGRVPEGPVTTGAGDPSGAVAGTDPLPALLDRWP